MKGTRALGIRGRLARLDKPKPTVDTKALERAVMAVIKPRIDAAIDGYKAFIEKSTTDLTGLKANLTDLEARLAHVDAHGNGQPLKSSAASEASRLTWDFEKALLGPHSPSF